MKLLPGLVLVLAFSAIHCASAATTPPAFTSPPTASTAIPLAGQLVTFIATATDPQGLPLTFIYDYGDGTVDTLGAHIYTAPGAYTVMVTASNCFLNTTTSIPITIRGFSNLWIKKESIKTGAAGKGSWQAQLIYNADRTSASIFNPARDVFITSLGNIAGIQIDPGKLTGTRPKFVFKSAKGTTPSISATLDESSQTITISAKAATFTDKVPAALHNLVQLGTSTFVLDSVLDAKGSFTPTAGYRTVAFVVATGSVSIKAAGKDSIKFSLLLGDPAFQFPGASGAKTVRFRITNSAGKTVADKDFTSIAAFSAGKFKSGKDSATPAGKFSYDSLKGAMSVTLSKATLTGVLSAPEENVRVDVVLGDQTYSTRVTLFAPKTGAYSTTLGKVAVPVTGTTVATPIQPTVISTNPVNGATGVAINQKVTATFSGPMDPSTINTGSFIVRQGTTILPGTVALIGTTATFTSNGNLAPNAAFTATITTDAKDSSGNALTSSYVWCFTTGVPADTTAPVVISTQPANAATGVAINRKISATFSKAMDPSSITASTFTLQQGTTAVAGSISYTGATATLAPTANLAPNTVFTATITTGAKDLAGNAVASNFVWTFTTSASADTTPPTVTSTYPANGATGVAVNRTVNATFNKAMDPSTLTTANFTVAGSNAIPIAGSVSFDSINNIATFVPSNNLAVNATFTATVTTGVKDLAGNAMTSNFVWSFSTGAQMAQAKVVLGSAGTFAILAGSTVTNTGPTVINGDLGVSPGSAVTGFPPGNVNGAMHVTDSAAAQAKNDLLAAYNDGAARLGAAVLPGNLGGLTLTPGLYKNSSSTGITGTGPQGILTLDAQGDPNAVFIFQMGSTLTTDSSTQVVLSGGAKAANIFWQVGSSATFGTTSIFKGNVLADQSITLNTSATLDGRALTRIGAVTLAASTVTKPAP